GGSVALGGGDDVLNVYTGASFSGGIDGGGNDSVNLNGAGAGSLPGLVNFETVNLNSGDWTLGSEGFHSLNLAAGPQILRLSQNTLADGHFDATLTGFTADDLIDLKGIGSAAGATLGPNNLLTVAGGSIGAVTLQLDPGQDFTGKVFRVASDNAGGTNLTIDNPPVFTSPTDFSVPENQTAVGVVMASDPEHDAISFTLAGGADQGFF